MTLQELFDANWQHFVVEKNPQSKKDGRCMYGGTGCAIGCVMPDELKRFADRGFDDSSSIEALLEHPRSKAGRWVRNELPEKASNLQGIHDRYIDGYGAHGRTFTEWMTDGLKEFAESNGLKIPETTTA